MNSTAATFPGLVSADHVEFTGRSILLTGRSILLTDGSVAFAAAAGTRQRKITGAAGRDGAAWAHAPAVV